GMEFESIVVALILLAALFGWYAWLEAGERRRSRAVNKRSSLDGAGDGRPAGADGELWKGE
ncbi:MAG TPA: hypothetical protein VGV38_04845, partial [Pyrinomonadaceae bacterium]|nr:hypothetical protein [Pyrinomonadaceae bacterium]